MLFNGDTEQGNVTKQLLSDVLQDVIIRDDAVSADRLDATVSCMKVVNHQGLGNFVVAGDEDGVVRIWNVESVPPLVESRC